MVDTDALRYSVLKEEEVEELLAFLAEHFFPREPLCAGLNITYDDVKEWFPGSVHEMARSGVSVVARDPTTGQVCGALVASVLTREEANTFQQTSNTTNTKVEALYTVFSVLRTAVNLFARYEKADRILNLAVIAVSEKLAGCGVGKRLFQKSENLGRHLGCQLATAEATATRSQRILHCLGYKSLYTMDYTTFEIAGDRVFDVDKMLGTRSAKVMVRLLKTEGEQPNP